MLFQVLWFAFCSSFISTYCYFFVHFKLDKDRATLLIVRVRALAELLNLITGGLAFLFSVFVENLYGEEVQLIVYILIQIALRS